MISTTACCFLFFQAAILQSHMFWWDSEPSIRFERPGKRRIITHIHDLYSASTGDRRRERPIRKSATIIVMSDHGFANFAVSSTSTTWLREKMNTLGQRNAPRS